MKRLLVSPGGESHSLAGDVDILGMRYGRYGLSYLFLRLGLALTFLWIGVDIFRHPDTWIGYVPVNPGFGLSQVVALQIGGLFDIALGVLLVLRVWTKLVGLLVAIHMIGIIVVHGIDAVLVRDIAIIGAGLALATWPNRYRKRRLSRMLPFGKKGSGDE